MGKISRDIGYRTENNVRKQALNHNLHAYRVPLSGGASIKGDVVVSNGTDDWRLEVKNRANGFKQIYDWLDSPDADALVIKAKGKRTLLVCDLDDFFDLLRGKDLN